MVDIKFLAKRLALTVFSLWAVATILFVMVRLMPGDPTTLYFDPEISLQDRQRMAKSFGIDEPMHVQYVLYMRNLLLGNLGLSFSHSEPVADLLLRRLPNTLVLTLTSVVMAFIIGPVVGAYLAWRRGSKVDTYGIALVLGMNAAPVFWTGMLGIMLFSFHLGWVPSGGMRSATFVADDWVDLYFSVDFLHHLLLPATVMTLYWMGPPALVMRNNMIEVLGDDFIQMNRAQGLSEMRILYHHAARNAMLPVTHYAALSLGFAFGGSVIIETVFSWPGIGRLMWNAVLNQNYPLAQGAFLMLASVIIIMNFIVDLVSVYIDPRVAEEEVMME